MIRRKRRRRSRNFDRTRLYDVKDGIDINRLWRGRNISKYRRRVSMFESDNVYIEWEGDTFGKEVSIMHRVHNINRYKSHMLNPDFDLINRKA